MRRSKFETLVSVLEVPLSSDTATCSTLFATETLEMLESLSLMFAGCERCKCGLAEAMQLR